MSLQPSRDACLSEGPYCGQTLQVVFKIVERCNINCSYCYYFNMGDESAFSRPVKATPEAVAEMADWIARGCQQLGFSRVLFSFHGGEPMLVKPREFERMCDALRERIEPVVPLSFTIQTNGTVLSEEWLQLFDKFKVHVGVSIDGDRIANDRYRLDHQGRSTFKQVEQNLRTFVEWSNQGKGRGVSTISVMDYRNDYDEIYRYLRASGVRQMSFLLPDTNRDRGFTVAGESSLRYGECMAELFTAWLREDNRDVFVRQIVDVLHHFQIKDPQAMDGDPAAGGQRGGFQIIVMHSDGSVTVNDSFIPALQWYENAPTYNVREHSLEQFLADPIFGEVSAIQRQPAAECRQCEWRGICRGGDIENRFSSANGFDNPSVYCEGYKHFYGEVVRTLQRNGYPAELLEQQLERSLEAFPH